MLVFVGLCTPVPLLSNNSVNTLMRQRRNDTRLIELGVGAQLSSPVLGIKLPTTDAVQSVARVLSLWLPHN
jgi:hypothetical protein